MCIVILQSILFLLNHFVVFSEYEPWVIPVLPAYFIRSYCQPLLKDDKLCILIILKSNFTCSDTITLIKLIMNCN